MLEWINRLMTRVERWFAGDVAAIAAEAPRPPRDLAAAVGCDEQVYQIPNTKGRKLKLFDVWYHDDAADKGGIVQMVSDSPDDTQAMTAAVLTWLASRGIERSRITGIKRRCSVDFVHFHGALFEEQEAHDGQGQTGCG